MLGFATVRRFLFQTIHDVELMLESVRAGGEPFRGVIDARLRQKIVGASAISPSTRMGLLMINLIADISDSAQHSKSLDAIRKRWPWVKHLFADGAYDRLKLMDKAAYLEFVIEIVRRRDGQKGFEVLPRRWVVERTFGWMIRWRRLVRDYERRIDVSTAMILVAMGGNSSAETLTPDFQNKL